MVTNRYWDCIKGSRGTSGSQCHPAYSYRTNDWEKERELLLGSSMCSTYKILHILEITNTIPFVRAGVGRMRMASKIS